VCKRRGSLLEETKARAVQIDAESGHSYQGLFALAHASDLIDRLSTDNGLTHYLHQVIRVYSTEYRQNLQCQCQCAGIS